MMFLFCLFMGIWGVLYIVFAFRDPPPWAAGLVRIKVPLFIGLLLLLVPEQHQTRAGRLTLGSILLLACSIGIVRDLYHLAFGWS